MIFIIVGLVAFFALVGGLRVGDGGFAVERFVVLPGLMPVVGTAVITSVTGLRVGDGGFAVERFVVVPGLMPVLGTAVITSVTGICVVVGATGPVGGVFVEDVPLAMLLVPPGLCDPSEVGGLSSGGSTM